MPTDDVRNHWSDQGLAAGKGSTMAWRHFGATELDRQVG
jgi:hypothetical protein